MKCLYQIQSRIAINTFKHNTQYGINLYCFTPTHIVLTVYLHIYTKLVLIIAESQVFCQMFCYYIWMYTYQVKCSMLAYINMQLLKFLLKIIIINILGLQHTYK